MNATFKDYVRSRRPESARIQLNKAYQANKIAKVCVGRARQVLYGLKYAHLSAGLELSDGGVFCDSVPDDLSDLIGVTTLQGYRFHVPSTRLSRDALRSLQITGRRVSDAKAA
jgi:hypothetical protein